MKMSENEEKYTVDKPKIKEVMKIQKKTMHMFLAFYLVTYLNVHMHKQIGCSDRLCFCCAA